jgi:predicted enzyme related to lactoylglutathione lyase
MSEEVADGTLCHLEIPAPDLGRAKAFFGAVFGWEFEAMGDRYLLFRYAGGSGGGGLDMDAEPADGGSVPVFAVGDIDAKLAQIESLGGAALTPRTELPGGHGAYAYFRGPNGNKLGLWSTT